MKKEMISINLGCGFYLHLTVNGDTAVDRQGDRWYLMKGEWLHEHGLHYVRVEKIKKQHKKP